MTSRGTIRERRPGVWQVQFLVATRPRRRYRTATVRGTRAEAEAERDRMAAQLALGELDTAPDTLGAWLDAWADHHALGVATATADTVAVCLARVPAQLRARKLRDVGADDLRRWVVDMHRAGLAPGTIGVTITPVRAALAVAVTDGIIRRNPAAGLRPPRDGRPKRPAMSDGDVAAMLAAAAEHSAMHGALWRLVASTGCRPSDALAVQWGDLDLDGGVLRFRRHVTGDGQIAPGGKTGRERTVALDPATVAAVRRWVADLRAAHLRFGVRWGPAAWIFPAGGTLGGHLTPAGARQTWATIRRRAGLEGWTPRDLRHWHASTLVHAGVPIDVVADRLGHAQVSTTLDVYGGHLGADQSAAVEVMRRLGEGS